MREGRQNSRMNELKVKGSHILAFGIGLGGPSGASNGEWAGIGRNSMPGIRIGSRLLELESDREKGGIILQITSL
jgi:hypothetical protein